MNQAFQDYQALVDAQSVKPTKQRVTQIRKSLIVLKKCCDTQRKEILNKPKSETPEVTPEVKVEPLVEPEVQSPDVKLTQEDVSWQSPLPLTREVTVSVDSSEPVTEVKVKKNRKTKKAKAM